MNFPEKLYKYRSDVSDKDQNFSALINDEFYCASLSSLNDPYEAIFNLNRTAFGIVDRVLEKDFSGGIIDQFERLKSDCAVYSLSASVNSELLWAHYAREHKGFCIEYDVQKLVPWFPDDEFKKISYKKEYEGIGLAEIPLAGADNNAFCEKMFFTKSEAWDYEEEWRLLVIRSGLRKYDFRAVTGIYFGLATSKEFIAKVMKGLAGRSIKYYQMKLCDHSYLLEPFEIEDHFSAVGLSVKEVEPKIDYSIFGWDLDYGVNKLSMLKRAVDLITQDPYCAAIEGADFSMKKGFLYVAYRHKILAGIKKAIFEFNEEGDLKLSQLVYHSR